ncbi:hypothetical protein [Mycolicibacterium sp. XJ870]
MSKFSDNLDLVAREGYVPTTAQALLAHLQLDDAPRPRQEAAIKDWLKMHPPGRAMEFTLRRKGFGHLLDNRSSA